MRTAKEVLSALQVVKPTPKQKEHAKTLADIFVMIKELAPKVVDVERKENEFYFGREYSYKTWNSERYVSIDGITMKGELWTIKTLSGSYTVSLPIDNPLYYAFCNLFTQFVSAQTKPESITPDRIFVFSKEPTTEVKKAMKFIVFDRLQDSMNNVHVKVKDGYVEIMGTNGTKLYRSGFLYYDESEKDITFLLPIESLKAANIKDSLTIGLYFDRDTITKGVVNGVSFDHCQASPLQYDNVIPEYYDFVQFNKKELIQVIKSVLPTANKVTHAINFYFNGAIQVSAEDLYFSYENDVRIPYSKKTCKDFKIAFNGKLLLDCLNSIDGNLVRLYSNGENNKPIVIDNKALLMPVVFIDRVEKTADEIAKELHELRNVETI